MANYKVTVNCKHCNDTSRTHHVEGDVSSPEGSGKVQAAAVIAHRNSYSHFINTGGNTFSGSDALTIKPSRNSDFDHGKEHNG